MEIDILGVKVDNVTPIEALERIEQMIQAGGKHLVVTPYSEMIVKARQDPSYREILNRASLSLPDGVGILWAADLLRRQLPVSTLFRFIFLAFLSLIIFLRIGLRRSALLIKETVSGADLVGDLAHLSAKKGYRMFLLGGRGDTSQRASDQLSNINDHLIIDSRSGLINVQRYSVEENSRVINEVNKFSPDLLLVAYGPPYQERWIIDNWDQLNFKVAIGVGGTFDYLAGNKKRAPLILRRLGLESLWRLFLEPRRFLRIFKAWLVFPALVFWHLLIRSSKDSTLRQR